MFKSLILICIIVFVCLTSIESLTDFKDRYKEWESVPVNDTILWEYVPGVEELLNQQIKSPFWHVIDHFVQAYTKGLPIFNYKVSFVLQQTSALKAEHTNQTDEHDKKVANKQQSCISTFDVNPWGENYTIKSLDCSVKDIEDIELLDLTDESSSGFLW